jgi:hypothetical protein
MTDNTFVTLMFESKKAGGILRSRDQELAHANEKILEKMAKGIE